MSAEEQLQGMVDQTIEMAAKLIRSSKCSVIIVDRKSVV